MLKKNLKFLLLLPLLLAFTVHSVHIKNHSDENTDPPFVNYSSQWVDSVFNSMTLDQKIGQLFMIDAYPNQTNQAKVEHLITNYHVGGIIYFKGHPTKVAQMTNHFQSIAQTPLMMAMDAEWGVGMRLDSVVVFPQQLMLGAIEDNTLLYSMGEEIAKQCKTLGININFAPVVDINNNPMNPVIGVRSFGENKVKVSQKGYAYALGMQDNKVLAVAKHFPGHGDTDVDSHKDLPIINASADRLDSLEMYPFKELINAGIGGVMMAHLYIPALDNTQNLPSSLSQKIVNDILLDELQFKGLVFTDALGMQGVAKFYGPGDAEIMALKAGVDVLLMSQDVIKAFNKIKAAVQSGEISEQLIDEKVKKILTAKYWMDLHQFKPIDINSIKFNLQTPARELVNRQLVENALTLVKNDDNLIPFTSIGDKKFACISIGSSSETIFQDYLARYAQIDNFNIDKNASVTQFNQLKTRLADYDYVIVGIHDTKKYSVSTYGITSNTINFVDNLANSNNVVLTIFGPPYALKRFNNLAKMKAILMSYEDTDISQELSAQLLFGGIKAKGKLPVSVGTDFNEGDGFLTSRIRLKYSIPEELHIDYRKLYEIDTLIYHAISEKALPGCQVLAIKNGVVFFEQSYGYQTYKMKDKIEWDNVYDIASITKVAATTTSLMKLYEIGEFSVDAKMVDYLSILDSTNKQYLKVIDVLTHQARLKSWIPFFKRGLNSDMSWKPEYYSSSYSDDYSVKICDNVYTKPGFQDEIYEKIIESDLYSRKRYKYSDLGFYLFKRIIEDKTLMSLDDFVKMEFYKNLGAYSMTYNPLDNSIPLTKIPPTEYDYRFRKQVVHGYVHDYGAAILDGIGGHAGLFANANDLGKLFQMLISDGWYAGEQYLEKSTIQKFTTKPFYNSRRALGFDSTDGNGKGPACSLSSSKSFGHTGFTGCMVWADPRYDFIYVFLSNRVYPSIDNNAINDLNLREKVQSLLYQSFIYYSN